MAAHEQFGKSQKRRRFPWLRIVIAFIALLLLIAAALIWFIDENWSSSLTIIFAVLGVALTLIAWLFPVSSDKPEVSKDPGTPHISPLSPINVNVSPNISPNISVSPNQSIFLQTPPNEINAVRSTGVAFLTGDTITNQPDGRAALDGGRTALEADLLPKVEVTQNLPDPDSVFLFNAPLPKPSEFYGRDRERAVLLNRTRIRASTSIIGSRRIGKTWLVSYLRSVAPIELGSNFHVGCLDATSSQCSTVAGFTAKALEILGFLPDTGMDKLERAIGNLISNHHTPVLCIDEFEGFINDQQEFNRRFFDGLRAMTQQGLVLVTVSKKPLSDIIVDTVGKGSPFFNVFLQLMLTPFKASDAKSFVQAKGTQAGFTDEECSYLLEYAREDEQLWPPLRLQLVGHMLLEDKVAAQANPDNYLLGTQRYWRDFEKRLDETYYAVVRP